MFKPRIKANIFLKKMYFSRGPDIIYLIKQIALERRIQDERLGGR